MKLSRSKKCDIALVTVTDVEREEVVKEFKMIYVQDPIREYFKTSINRLDIVMYQSTDVGNLPSGILTSYIINTHQPKIIIKIGTCGIKHGVTQIKIKSVLVTSQISYLGKEKIKPGKILVELLSSSCSERLLRLAKICKSKEKWRNLIKIGEIVSTERLLSDPSSDVIQRILSRCPNAIGFEMDAEGVLKAVQESGMDIEVIVIDGASDYIDQRNGDATRHTFNRIAARNAAKFAFDMVHLLPSKDTEVRKIIKSASIVSLLPLIGGFALKTLKEKWVDLMVAFFIGISVHLWH